MNCRVFSVKGVFICNLTTFILNVDIFINMNDVSHNWIWFQILVHLCKHTSPAEELARKDDLSLLFSAITSWCPPHNAIWRKCAADILMTLSRHGLTPNVVRYIHGNFLYLFGLPYIRIIKVCWKYAFTLNFNYMVILFIENLGKVFMHLWHLHYVYTLFILNQNTF